jgi:hypothetical protein
LFFFFCSAVTFTNPPKTTDDGKSLFAKYPQKPDKLPIRYFTQLKSDNFQPVTFSNIHGPELELYCEYKVALRKRMFLKVYLKNKKDLFIYQVFQN